MALGIRQAMRLLVFSAVALLVCSVYSIADATETGWFGFGGRGDAKASLGRRRRRRPAAVDGGAPPRAARNATRRRPAKPRPVVDFGACGWCGAVPGVDARPAVDSLDAWAGGEPPCDWCAATQQEHAYCQGFGGRRCANGVNRCAVALAQLQLHCADAYATGAVDGDACASRCAHAAAAAPAPCAAEWVAGHGAAARRAAKACGADAAAFFSSAAPAPLVVFTHLQKTGGWSVVDVARRAGARCPPKIANAAVPRGKARPGPGDAETRDGCAAYRPAWESNLQPDFNVSVFGCFDTSTSAVLREHDESNRSVQKSAESTSI